MTTWSSEAQELIGGLEYMDKELLYTLDGVKVAEHNVMTGEVEVIA